MSALRVRYHREQKDLMVAQAERMGISVAITEERARDLACLNDSYLRNMRVRSHTELQQKRRIWDVGLRYDMRVFGEEVVKAFDNFVDHAEQARNAIHPPEAQALFEDFFQPTYEKLKR